MYVIRQACAWSILEARVVGPIDGGYRIDCE